MTSNIFFAADTHFGHEGIIPYCSRPFNSASHMDASLIARWNAVVGPTSMVYFLGDLSFHREQKSIERILRQLNGHIHFIEGNHDRNNKIPKDRWESYSPLKEIKINKQKLVLCHYPMMTWNQSGNGSWHLHGHWHGSYAESRPENETATIFRLDVGIDVWNYAPVSFEQIQDVMHLRAGRR